MSQGGRGGWRAAAEFGGSESKVLPACPCSLGLGEHHLHLDSTWEGAGCIRLPAKGCRLWLQNPWQPLNCKTWKFGACFESDSALAWLGSWAQALLTSHRRDGGGAGGSFSRAHGLQ